MHNLRNYVSGHFQPKIKIPDIIYLLEGLHGDHGIHFEKQLVPHTGHKGDPGNWYNL